MWRAEIEHVRDGQRVRFYPTDGDHSALTFEQALTAWRDDPGARRFTVKQLAEAPFHGFFWELPRLSRATAHRPFEYVTIESRRLGWQQADPSPFHEQFANSQRTSAAPANGVITFKNLGGDATLVVPLPPDGEAPIEPYAHLGKFMREAPEAHRCSLLEELATAALAHIATSPEPVWISTSGLGVSWLHVRLDAQPKYYSFQEYCDREG